MKSILKKIDSLLFLKSISRKTRKNNPLSDELRNKILKENQNAFSHEMTHKDLVVDFEKPEKKVSEASRILKENGVVILENFIPNDLALNAGKEFLSFFESSHILTKLEKEDYFETEQFLAQNGRSKLNGYSEYASYVKPVIVKRRKSSDEVDGGMIDCFGMNKNITSNFPQMGKCYAVMCSEIVSKIILQQTAKKLTQQQLNLYYNNSVKNPRTLHVDSVFEAYKVFVYLSDCNHTSSGPYSYVPKSFLRRNAIKKNIKRNFEFSKPDHFEDIIINKSLAIPLIGKAGTMIITAQNGIHGGIEQEEGKHRIVMVDSYYK